MDARAAVQVADRTIEIQQFTVPEHLGEGEALLKIEGTGTCGSDVEQYHGATARRGLCEYPVIPGHEPVGRIAAISDTARQLWGVSGLSGTAARLAPVSCWRHLWLPFHDHWFGPVGWIRRVPAPPSGDGATPVA
jgi:hypothetical protein